MQLPIFLSQNKDLTLMQNKWKSILDVLLGNPSVQNIILPNVLLINGSTNVSHMLGRKLLGWRIVRQRAAAQIHDNQDSNQTPTLTLTLISNAAVSVDLEVF